MPAHRTNSTNTNSRKERQSCRSTSVTSHSASHEITAGGLGSKGDVAGRMYPQSEVMASGPAMTIANLPGSSSSSVRLHSTASSTSTHSPSPRNQGKDSPHSTSYSETTTTTTTTVEEKTSSMSRKRSQDQTDPSVEQKSKHRQKQQAQKMSQNAHYPAYHSQKDKTCDPYAKESFAHVQHRMRREESFDVNGWPEGIDRPRRFLGMRFKPVSQWQIKHIFCLSY